MGKDKVIRAFQKQDSGALFEALCGLSDVFLGKEDKTLRLKKKDKLERLEKFFEHLRQLEELNKKTSVRRQF